MEICGDNRFEIIAKAKAHLLDATNIDTSEDEMKVLDSFLFRCWQMGWLDRYDRTTEPTISKMEQVEDETKTQMKTQNSNLTFEKRKCIDCNFLTYMFGKTWCNIKCENPHDKVCDRFKPKDEPQTEREDE